MLRLLTMAALVLSMSFVSSFAQNVRDDGIRIAVPKGSKVTVKGNTARIRKPNGVVITTSCTCDHGGGTCTVTADKSGVLCYKGVGATCKGNCEASSTINSLSHGGILQ